MNIMELLYPEYLEGTSLANPHPGRLQRNDRAGRPGLGP
jgi:hypothetical protein